MAKTASIDKMNMLHDLLATYYKELLESDEGLSSGELSALNAFLKNNDITATPLDSAATGSLASTIQSLIDESKAERGA